MHVQLTEDNKQKMLKASGELNRSVNEIVNMLIDLVDEFEVQEHLSVKLNKMPEQVKPEEQHRPTQLKSRTRSKVRFRIT